jgi:hypothetical protein
MTSFEQLVEAFITSLEGAEGDRRRHLVDAFVKSLKKAEEGRRRHLVDTFINSLKRAEENRRKHKEVCERYESDLEMANMKVDLVVAEMYALRAENLAIKGSPCFNCPANKGKPDSNRKKG